MAKAKALLADYDPDGSKATAANTAADARPSDFDPSRSSILAKQHRANTAKKNAKRRPAK